MEAFHGMVLTVPLVSAAIENAVEGTTLNAANPICKSMKSACNKLQLDYKIPVFGRMYYGV